MKEYLLYLFGELTEYHSEQYPDIRFWKNKENDVVLELEKSGRFWIDSYIWDNFSNFCLLTPTETKEFIKKVLEEHLNLKKTEPEIYDPFCSIALPQRLESWTLRPVKTDYFRKFSWEHLQRNE